MSYKCEFCGNYYEGGGVYSYFEENLYSEYFITYHFCCRGHFDAFCNQTSMLEVNENGLTQEEQEQKDYNEKYRECGECGSDYLKGTGITRDGYYFCSKDCLNLFFKPYNNPAYIRKHYGKIKGEDEFFTEAAILFVENQMASVSMLQRRLSIGYNHASDIQERLLLAGIIGHAESEYTYKVLVKDFYNLSVALGKLASR